MKKYSILLCLLFLLVCLPFSVFAHHDLGNATDSVASIAIVDSLPASAEGLPMPVVKKKKSFLRRLHDKLKDFSRVDTNYIEKQKYNFTAMLQNTNTFERYELISKSGQTIDFAPEPSYKIGPYIGWQWIFLGYTIDFTHLRGSDNRQDFDLSLYSNQIGVDLFYRKTGDNYKIRSMHLGDDVDTRAMEGVNFDGFKASIKGFNLYYIFNHKKFSYPAAYSQSTIQRRSAGSPLVGIGYTKHSIDIDWNKLQRLAEDKLGTEIATTKIDSALMFDKAEFIDYSISGGYAYNWVFARNWLFDASLSLAVSYKRAKADVANSGTFLRDFDFKNINLDGVARLGLVWNNMRWYYGTSAIFHTYNYKKKQFRTNTIFGSVNVYIGFNFW